MKKYVIMAKMLIIILATLIIVGCTLYRYEISPISKSTDTVEVMVDSGDSWYSLGTTLKSNKLIRSINFYKIYIKLMRPNSLEAGKYNLSPNMSLEEIISTLEAGSTYNPDDVSLTFKEGINMRAIATIISTNTNNSYDSVFTLLKDDNYISSLISSYWFLTDDIKDDQIYYPLEGYLFPDTYEVSKTASVKDIFKLMLDKTDRVLTTYKSKINSSKYSVHQLMTLASIVELEAGNSNDRSKVAGVFYNRIENNWTLGSDITTFYAFKIDNYSTNLTSSQLASCNPYNTRGTCFTGLPIGPVCNPGEDSIKAVLNPTTTDMYYFVADCSGNTYLMKTETEQDSKIAELKKDNNWCE